MPIGSAAGLFAAAVFLLLAGTASPAAACQTRGSAAETAIVAEINLARAHPETYARSLERRPVSAWEAALRASSDRGEPGALADAVRFLMAQTPAPPLSVQPKLRAAACEHAALQGRRGLVGHEGVLGERFDLRLRRHGVRGRLLAENISYGPVRPRDVVRELIIDAGVADRGHRRNIFDARLERIGVGCGPHRAYRQMCVIDFAGEDNGPTPETSDPIVIAQAEPLRLVPASCEVEPDLQTAPACALSAITLRLQELSTLPPVI